MLLLQLATFTIALAAAAAASTSSAISTSAYSAPPSMTAASGFETRHGMSTISPVGLVEPVSVNKATLQAIEKELALEGPRRHFRLGPCRLPVSLVSSLILM